MVKKKIKKFFNSVSIRDTMMVLVEEEKKNHISLIWLASASFFILLVCIGAFFVIKDELPVEKIPPKGWNFLCSVNRNGLTCGTADRIVINGDPNIDIGRVMEDFAVCGAANLFLRVDVIVNFNIGSKPNVVFALGKLGEDLFEFFPLYGRFFVIEFVSVTPDIEDAARSPRCFFYVVDEALDGQFAFVMVRRGMPFLEAFGKRESVRCFDGSAVDDGSGIHGGEGVVVIGAEGISQTADDRARCLFEVDTVGHQLVVLVLDEHSFEMRMRIRMTCDFMTVIYEKGTYLLGVNALGFGITEVFGIEIEGAFHAVFVEKLNESSVLRTAVIVTEGQRVAFAILESVE